VSLRVRRLVHPLARARCRTTIQIKPQSFSQQHSTPDHHRSSKVIVAPAQVIYRLGQPSQPENKARNEQAKSIALPRIRRPSGFVQISLSQVPRRDTLRSTRKLGAGALVDRDLRYSQQRPHGGLVWRPSYHKKLGENDPLSVRGHRRGSVNCNSDRVPCGYPIFIDPRHFTR
jgi:hypothetical protein